MARRQYSVHKRGDREQYLAIGYPMAKSLAWRSLGGNALKVWIELHTRYHGHNNGKLSLSFDEAARLLHMGKASVSRAFAELKTKGFIKLRKQGRWYGRKASEYELTTKPCDGRIATQEWRNWRPRPEDKCRRGPKKSFLGFDPDHE